MLSCACETIGISRDAIRVLSVARLILVVLVGLLDLVHALLHLHVVFLRDLSGALVRLARASSRLVMVHRAVVTLPILET